MWLVRTEIGCKRKPVLVVEDSVQKRKVKPIINIFTVLIRCWRTIFWIYLNKICYQNGLHLFLYTFLYLLNVAMGRFKITYMAHIKIYGTKRWYPSLLPSSLHTWGHHVGLRLSSLDPATACPLSPRFSSLTLSAVLPAQIFLSQPVPAVLETDDDSIGLSVRFQVFGLLFFATPWSFGIIYYFRPKSRICWEGYQGISGSPKTGPGERKQGQGEHPGLLGRVISLFFHFHACGWRGHSMASDFYPWGLSATGRMTPVTVWF